MSFYDSILCFFLYGFLGWCTEVAFAAVKEKRFVNRGFLNGPICPVYGFGVVTVVCFLNNWKEDILLLYIASIVVVTAIEWFTGFLLEKLFHNKWWDYSDMPLNLNGYVCLLFSLIWGAGCVVIVKLLHPVFYKGITYIPRPLGIFLIAVLGIAAFADLYATASNILKMNRRLEKMEEIAKELHRISEGLGANIYEDVMEAMEKKDELSEDIKEKMQGVAEDARERSAQLRSSYMELKEKNLKQAKRFLKAFPHMNSKRYKEALKDLQEYFEELRKNK